MRSFQSFKVEMKYQEIYMEGNPMDASAFWENRRQSSRKSRQLELLRRRQYGQAQ